MLASLPRLAMLLAFVAVVQSASADSLSRADTSAAASADTVHYSAFWRGLSFLYRGVEMQEPNYLVFGFQGASTGIAYKNQVKILLSARIDLAQWIYGTETIGRGYPVVPYSKSLTLNVGYQQRTFWNLYDGSESRPVYDNNYSPSISATWNTTIARAKLPFALALGYMHESNGGQVNVSRSWERLFARVGVGSLEINVLSAQVEAWYPYGLEENPDMYRYTGLGKLTLYCQPLLKLHFPLSDLGLSVSTKLAPANLANVELGVYANPLRFVSLALRKEVSDKVRRITPTIYLQYYYGRGENLYDYTELHSSFRVGIATFY